MEKLNIKRFGSTNKTTNYNLSQFVGSDKPSWLNDINADMSAIDVGIHTAQTTADGAQTTATNAATAAEGAQTTANTAVTNAAAAQTSADTANGNIGTLANLETTVKNNLVSAINELVNNVVNTDTVSTVKSYSTSYSDSKYKLKHAHAESNIFEGNIASGNQIQINTTWSALGIFSFMIVEFYNPNLNTRFSVIYNYDLISNGSDLYSGRRLTNVGAIAHNGATVINPGFVPDTALTSNTITIGGAVDCYITRIDVVE